MDEDAAGDKRPILSETRNEGVMFTILLDYVARMEERASSLGPNEPTITARWGPKKKTTENELSTNVTHPAMPPVELEIFCGYTHDPKWNVKFDTNEAYEAMYKPETFNGNLQDFSLYLTFYAKNGSMEKLKERLMPFLNQIPVPIIIVAPNGQSVKNTECQQRLQFDYTHINHAVSFLPLPDDLKAQIVAQLRPDGSRAMIHGIIHRHLEQKSISELTASVLLRALSHDTDADDLILSALRGDRRKTSLAEQVMTSGMEDCIDACYTGLSPEAAQKLKEENAEFEFVFRMEEGFEDRLLSNLVDTNVTVIEANKQYPHRPILMVKLAQARGDEGFEELASIYPDPKAALIALQLISK